MTFKKAIIGAVVIVVGAPMLLVAIAVVSFYALLYFPNRTTAVRGTLVSSGHTREYLLYVPRSYDPATPVPLVISMHPAMSWPSSEMNISQWNRVADQHGFIVVYPAGIGSGPKTWFMEGSQTPSRMPDVLFISKLIDTLESSYNIDATRIYADGMSNGGGMAFALSCALSRRIAAIGAVSAAQSLPFSWCSASPPMPMIAFHGTGDPVVPYGGHGPGWLNPRPFPNVRSWVADWARRNRCGPAPIDSVVAADVTRLQYTDCADNAGVELFTVKEGGHQWPGGKPLPTFLVGRYTRSIDATSLEWGFFSEHRLVGH